MTKTIVPSLLGVLLLGLVGGASASGISLVDWGYQIDGLTSVGSYGDPTPGGVDDTSFDYLSGLGSIDISITGAGTHSVDLWLDHEIDEPDNTFFNETGEAVGTLAAGQSWEIDEPGFGSSQNGTAGTPYIGDIFDNFSFSTLDDQAFYDAIDNQYLAPPDDVSMALGWDFMLAAGEEALVHFSVSDTIVPTGFYLHQIDPDSLKDLYFSSELTISGPVGVAEPAVWMLMFMGLIGLGFTTGRRTNRVYGH